MFCVDPVRRKTHQKKQTELKLAQSQYVTSRLAADVVSSQAGMASHPRTNVPKVSSKASQRVKAAPLLFDLALLYINPVIMS